MTKEEALQMCLEYIETNAHERRLVRWAIKDALAQPAQEPQVCCGEYDTCLRACTPRGRYLAQPEQEPVARVIDNGTPEGATEWIPFTNRVEPLKTGDFLYTHAEERNFCQRCGKRTKDIHTCTPPRNAA